MMFLSGCSNPGGQKEPVSAGGPADSLYTKPLTLAQVTTAMALAGLPLCKNQEGVPDDYAINDVTPAIYTIKQDNNILMIYIYESIALRKEACDNLGGFRVVSNKLPQKENWHTVAYAAKNALIIDMFNMKAYQSDPAAFEKFLKYIRTAADSLNDTEELVFQDKGSCWDATLTVSYYQNRYRDQDGSINTDQYANEKWNIKYLGSKPESVHHVKYACKSRCGGSSATVPMKKVGKDYYLDMFGFGSSSIPYKENVYTLTIQWDGKKETLYLKNYEPNI